MLNELVFTCIAPKVCSYLSQMLGFLYQTSLPGSLNFWNCYIEGLFNITVNVGYKNIKKKFRNRYTGEFRLAL